MKRVRTCRDFQTGLGTFDIIRCSGCGVLITSSEAPPSDLMYSGEYVPYSPTSASSSPTRAAWRRAAMSAAKRSSRVRYLKSVEGPTIDVGCGSGTLARIMAAAGADVIGVDVTLAALSAAEEFPRVVARPEALPFANESVRSLVLHHVLEHSDVPASVLREVARCATTGVVVRIVVPTSRTLLGRIFGEWFDGWDVPRHRVHFDEHTLVRVANQSNLCMREVRYFAEPGFVVRTIANALRVRLPLPIQSLLIVLVYPLAALVTRLFQRSCVVDALALRAAGFDPAAATMVGAGSNGQAT